MPKNYMVTNMPDTKDSKMSKLPHGKRGRKMALIFDKAKKFP
jgi:hypothetical protein